MKKNNTQLTFNIFIVIVIIEISISLSNPQTKSGASKNHNRQKKNTPKNKVIESKPADNKRKKVGLHYVAGPNPNNALQSDTLLKQRVKYLLSQSL